MSNRVKVERTEPGIRGDHEILGDVELMYELEQIPGMWIVKDTEVKEVNNEINKENGSSD